MKKQILYILLVLFLFTSISMACSVSDNQTLSDQEDAMEQDVIEPIENDVEFPTVIQKQLSDYISVNARCLFPESCGSGYGEQATLGKSMLHEISDDIVAMLLQNSEIEETETLEYDAITEEIFWTSGRSNRLSISSHGFLDYKKTEDYSYISNVIQYDNRFESYNADVYLQKENHSFMSQEEAWNNIKGFLTKIGVQVSDEYICYVMDYNDMKTEENISISRAEQYGDKIPTRKPSWTEDDNCYFFRTHTVWNEYPVIGPLTGEGIDSENVIAIYNKDGFIALLINGFYPLEKTQNIRLQHPDEVLISLQNFLGNIISNNTYEIQEISLCQKVLGYEAKNKLARIIPVWKCAVMVKSDDLNDTGYIKEFYFNAETLEQLL